jgi:hypothetical protein
MHIIQAELAPLHPKLDAEAIEALTWMWGYSYRK